MEWCCLALHLIDSESPSVWVQHIGVRESLLADITVVERTSIKPKTHRSIMNTKIISFHRSANKNSNYSLKMEYGVVFKTPLKATIALGSPWIYLIDSRIHNEYRR